MSEEQARFDREFAGIWLWWIWAEQIQPILDIVRPVVEAFAALDQPAQQGDKQ